jgi:iron complex transport system substrate-binding protein
MGEFDRLDPDGYAQYRARFPELERIPRIGKTASESFSTEQAIALKPQVAVFGLEGHGPSPNDTAVVERLQAAGIRVVFIDFRRDPLINTPRSMTLLGKVLGREKEARAFVDAYRKELARVTDTLKNVTDKPRVFLESRVGLREECCETMVSGMMGRFVDAAGGDNMARKLVPGEVGTVNLEYLLVTQPDVYVATAIGNRAAGSAQSRRILMGAGIAPGEAQASLQSSLQRTGISGLRAVKSGRAHAVWHHFYDSPFNVVAVQVFAKWFHPQRFAALDPGATMTMLYRRFQPVALDGTYWVSQP